MLIWGGEGPMGAGLADGAAYDPEGDAWQPLAQAPLPWSPKPAAVWTGTAWVVASAAVNDVLLVAAYEPTTDAWTLLPPLPGTYDGETSIAWTGSQLVLLNSTSGMFRLPPDGDEWLPVMPTPDGVPVLGPIGWTGTHVVGAAWRYQGTSTPASAYPIAWDPDTGSWEAAPLPPRPLMGARPVLVGARLVYPEAGIVFDLAERRWLEIPLPDAALRHEKVVVVVASDIFLWGGADDVHAGPTNEGALVMPDW